MAKMLNSGDIYPAMNLKLTNGSSFAIPAAIDSKYLIAIFYRGHW